MFFLRGSKLHIDIGGGSSGKSKYLQDGKKYGRTHTRDELDKRAQLNGTLQELDEILDSFDLDNTTQKYFSFSLSFKESYISEDILREIDDKFRDFLFAACAENEFYYCSEVHFPKIKSLNDMNGNSYERYPHIHVTVPEYNLYTGKRDNPLGKVDSIRQYINAFQENINKEYGLESPKDNRREIPKTKEEILARYELDYQLTSSEIKDTIFEIIRGNKEINSVEKLAEIASSFGDVRIRNQGKANEYINLKIEGRAKGINFNEDRFMNTYLASRDMRQTHEFANDKHLKLLAEWFEYKAIEARFVEKQSPKTREKYYQMSKAEQKEWLKQHFARHLSKLTTEREGRDEYVQNEILHTATLHPSIEEIPHFEDVTHLEDMVHLEDMRHVDDIPFFDELGGIIYENQAQGRGGFDLQDVSFRGDDGNRGESGSTSGAHSLSPHQRFNLVGTEEITTSDVYLLSDERGSSLTRRIIDQLTGEKEVKQPNWSELINGIEGSGFLNYLSYHYGLNRYGLSIRKNKQGIDRIFDGKHHYSASDFLTKRMNLSWYEAREVLERINREQQIGMQKEHAVTSQVMWQHFQRYEDKKEGLSTIKSAYFAQRRALRQQYRYRYQRTLSKGENNALRRLAYMREQEVLRIAKKVYEEKISYWKRRPHDRYMDYLQLEAQKGNSVALSELNRIYPLEERDDESLTFSKKDGVPFQRAFELSKMDYTVQIKRNGTIAYVDKAKNTQIVDTYHGIKVLNRTQENIVNALEMAKLRYGDNGFEIRNAKKEDLSIIKQAMKTTKTNVQIFESPKKSSQQGRK